MGGVVMGGGCGYGGWLWEGCDYGREVMGGGCGYRRGVMGGVWLWERGYGRGVTMGGGGGGYGRGVTMGGGYGRGFGYDEVHS